MARRSVACRMLALVALALVILAGTARPASADCALLDCDDGNPCTTDSCSEPDGCAHTHANGAPCSDGNACTLVDVCAGGACSGGSPKNCSDGNPCTTDGCDPGTGTCGYTDNTASCSDNDACTAGDTCGGGSCQPGTPIVCGDANACTDDSCHPAVGCLFTNDDTNTCADASVCTTGDHCTSGACLGSPVVCSEDANACTTAICQPGTGCGFIFNTASCDDGDACTLNDVCASGACTAGSPKNCSDGNPCTTDGCDSGTGTCGYTDNTASCSDDDACTAGDTCGGGSCQPGEPIVCGDANACTDDSCHPIGGCVYTNDDTNTCSDANLCTTADHCTSGACLGSPVVCSEDSNACTTAICEPGTGCGFIFNTASCDDGDACTVNDVCSGGACTAGSPKNCSDGNACTTDSCDPATGACGYADNTASCSDANACTSGDTCGGGSCQPGTPLVCDDATACTDDGCDPSVGCVFTADDTNTCSDADLCTTDHCASGVCVGDPITCPDDGNVCTSAACEPATGCVQLPNTASCDDGDACTAPDQCSAGACVGTAGACATCPALPSESCLEARPQGSTITLKDAANPRRDTLAWRWQSPIAMTPGDLGDPTADVGLLLCVYDQSAGASALAVSVDLPPGGICGRRPCWKTLRNGVGYQRAAKGERGGAAFRFKAGALKAGFTLAAGGPELAMPSLPLRKDPRVIVELHRTDQPTCWSARYERVTRSKPGAFKAVSE